MMQPELPELLLIPPMEEDEKAVLDYREEHFAVGENELHGACMLESIASFSDWLRRVRGNRRAETVFPPDWSPTDMMLVRRTSDRRLIGVVDVRHRLTEALRDFGGNIGYGVRPSERGKGYATEILRLALGHARRLGLREVLISCKQTNVASRRVIEKNGGILLRNFIFPDGKPSHMFLIRL